MFLSPDEIQALTRRRKFAAQARELDALGIPYRRRSDGSLVVLQVHVDWAHPRPSRQPQVRSA